MKKRVKDMQKKLKIGVIFEGCSTKYDVSLQSMSSIMENLDTKKYGIYPVGITKKGDWFLLEGECLPRIYTN